MARKDALVRLHKTLLARRDDLREKLSEELATLQDYNAGSTGDSADAAFVAGADEMSSALAELDARELRKIEAALERLQQGSYGVCEGCAQKIPIGRLNALPYSIYCIECQRESERYPGFEGRAGSGNWANVVDSDYNEDQSVNLSDLERGLVS